MTPDTRAARDRIARFLDSIDGFYTASPEMNRPGKIAPSLGNRDDDLTEADLRLVLAALNEHETPPASTPPEPETCGKRSTWQRWGGILGPCVKPPGHEADEWHLDARGCAWDPAIDATQGAAR